MTYNGRKVMEEVAAEAGWTVAGGLPGISPDSESVFYELPGEVPGSVIERVLIVWSAQNTGLRVIVNPATDRERELRGAGSLFAARNYIEANKVEEAK
jgi:hypothetical protein